MSRLREFAVRYHHVKRSLENQEEQRFEQVNKTYHVLSQAARAMATERQRAELERNTSRTATDWHMWHRYVQSLEATERLKQQHLSQVSTEREAQRLVLHSAHRETARWETLTDGLQKSYKAGVQRQEEKLADELATMKSGKGGA